MTNWEKYFGTPEKTARMATVGHQDDIDETYVFMRDSEGWYQEIVAFDGGQDKYQLFLEWLQQEAV